MKKLFAFTLVVFILLSNFTVRAETSSNENETAVALQEECNSLEDNSTLTIEVISELFWDELVDKSHSITSEEDRCVSWLINAVDEPQTIPAYPDETYISYSQGGIPLNNIEYDRLMQKFYCVIELYNHYHNLQLELTPKILNELYMQIDVKSTNLRYLENPVTQIGQLAHIDLRNGGSIRYWESSQNFGSGKSGMASLNNPYLSNDLIVTVNGVAYLDDDGNIISSSYGGSDEINFWEKRMLHISANGIDLGWVYPTDLTRVN